MASGLRDFRATGVGDDVPYWLTLLAEGQLAAGHVAAVIESLGEALERAGGTGVHVWSSEIPRLRGDAYRAETAGPHGSGPRGAAAHRAAPAGEVERTARGDEPRAAWWNLATGGQP